MRHYQLAKLVWWAGNLRTRKRLQKVVYLLQAAGCPLRADFMLHHYGPYSEEVARLTDEMVRTSLLQEAEGLNGAGKEYSYTLPEPVVEQLRQLESGDKGRMWADELAPFETRAKSLLSEDLRQLEYASTIVYFRRQGHEWDAAVEKAAEFKKTQAVSAALPLAKTVVG